MTKTPFDYAQAIKIIKSSPMLGDREIVITDPAACRKIRRLLDLAKKELPDIFKNDEISLKIEVKNEV